MNGGVRMKIINLTDRNFTEGEFNAIKQFRSYTDGVSFACLNENVMVIVDIENNQDPVAIKNYALNQLQGALQTHMDFDTFNMPDGHVLCVIQNGVVAISPMKFEEDEDTMGDYLMLREMCFNACEKREIIAVAYEED